MPRQALIDLDHLAVQTAGDHTLQRDLLKLFIEQLAIFRARLSDGPLERQMLLELVHAVKGSALAIGAMAVVVIAERTEAQLAAEPISTRPSGESPLRWLDSALAEACEFAAHLLQEPQSKLLAK